MRRRARSGSTPRARCVPRSPCPATTACASSCRRRRPREAEVDEAVQAQLRRHGQLADVERPAARGDYVTLDLNATRDGEDVAGLNTEDWSYEIGQGWVADDFDDQLIGASAGDELTFTTTPKGTEEQADFVGLRVGRAGARPARARPTTSSPRTSASTRPSTGGGRRSPSGCRSPSSTRPARSSSVGSPRRSPGSPRSSRPSRSCRATCNGASRAPCASCSPRASTSSSGCRSPARTPTASSRA